MNDRFVISGHPLDGLIVKTPNRFAMGLAIDVLDHLDSQPTINVKNTGWKNGFELEVAAWIPICAGNLEAELTTDGDIFEIRRKSGPPSEFAELYDLVVSFVETSSPTGEKGTRQ